MKRFSLRTARPKRLRLPRPSSLRWELGVALAVKFVLLFLIWWLWFSDRLDVRLTPEEVGQAVAGMAPEPAGLSR
ncbi:MAG: cytochrome oxidase putative small subunit CydP [Pseudomonadota bacterium]